MASWPTIGTYYVFTGTTSAVVVYFVVLTRVALFS